ncbi:hypothetical protein DFH27DRAFT_629287 [Peziza echinospora]|nr:hypothetical protein DFH27DRAFT_629287 [Peziza echinospora]
MIHAGPRCASSVGPWWCVYDGGPYGHDSVREQGCRPHYDGRRIDKVGARCISVRDQSAQNSKSGSAGLGQRPSPLSICLHASPAGERARPPRPQPLWPVCSMTMAMAGLRRFVSTTAVFSTARVRNIFTAGLTCRARMSARQLRSSTQLAAAAGDAAALSARAPLVPPSTPAITTTARRAKLPSKKPSSARTAAASTPRRSTRKPPPPHEQSAVKENEEKDGGGVTGKHNLPTPTPTPTKARGRDDAENTEQSHSPETNTDPDPRPQKRQKKSPSSSSGGAPIKPPSPFQNHPHPTPAEVKTVVDLLSSLHGVHTRPPKPPLPNLLVTGCGEVPSILDALIRTLLSASTTAANSNRAFKGLVDTFGICGKRGSVDWEKVRRASEKEVFEAIKSGGLANVKSKRIKKILQQVWDEAQERKRKIRERKEKKEVEGEDDEAADDGDDEGGDSIFVGRRNRNDEKVVVKETYHGHQLVPKKSSTNEINTTTTTATNGNATSTTTTTGANPSPPSSPNPNPPDDSGYESDDLSLDHLHLLPDDEAMAKLTSFDGIGFKTASCVMLFCMARDSFAVDTHVFRIARFLNWVPPDKATRESAFWHLDERVPDEFKYPLHQLFIKHGRSCRWCKAGGPLAWEEGVREVLRQRRGGGVKKEEEMEEEVEGGVGDVKKEGKKKSGGRAKRGRAPPVKKEDVDVDDEKVEENELEVDEEAAQNGRNKRRRVIKKEKAEDAEHEVILVSKSGNGSGVKNNKENGNEGKAKKIKIEEPEDLDEEKIVAEFPELKRCPIEHLVKRFHGASKGRGVKWEEGGDGDGGAEEKDGHGNGEEENNTIPRVSKNQEVVVN